MKRAFLLIVVVLALVLRFYHLDLNPPSLSWDEASIGYNAYSIAQTLKDEHGRFLPYDYFSAFGDYKPPASIYITALSVKMLGLSVWSVRMPFALLGVLTVLLTYFLAEELRRIFNVKALNSNYSILTSFLLAISPWHTILSRQSFEATIATFFIVLGMVCLLKGLRKGFYFVPGFISLVLSLYTFNSPRVFVPLLMIGFLIFFYKQIWKDKKWVIISCLVGFLLFLPLLPHLVSPLGQLRFKEVNIFSDSEVVVKANERISQDGNVWWSKIIHNRRIGYGLLFLSHYLDHFNMDYLFFHGDINPKFSTRTNGQFFIIEALFLITGLYFLLRIEKKFLMFVLFWLLIGLIPASVARETPHALRTEITLPMWQLISAGGLYYLINLITSKWKNILLILISFAIFLELSLYLHNYYTHYPKNYSQDWQYGYKLAADEIQSYQNNYDKIWVTEKYGRPYIFFLLYQKYDPYLFQNNQKTSIDSFGFYHINSYDKFNFGSFNSNNFSGYKTLLIGAPDEIPQYSKKIKDIYFQSGEKALVIAEI